MNDNAPYIKVSTVLDREGKLVAIRKGSAALVLWYMVLNQDESGMVPVGQRRIMAHTGIKHCDPIELALLTLEGAGLAQFITPDPKTGEHRMRLLGDYSRF